MSVYKYLIGEADIVPYKNISSNLDFMKKVQPYIKEAQDMDLHPSMGYAMFYDLLINYGTENAVLTLLSITGMFAGTELITADNGATAKMVSLATPGIITINYSGLTGTFVVGEIVTGSVSGATGIIQSDNGSNVMVLNTITGTFTTADELTGSLSGASSNFVANVTTASLTITGLSGSWSTALTITGGTSGATATIDSALFGKYYKLVNGDDYTDWYHFPVRYEGIKGCLAYWAIARFYDRGNGASTATGFVIKLTPESQPLGRREISELVNQAKSGALTYWHAVEKYLYDMYIQDANLFPLYAKTLFLQRRRKGGSKLSSVSKYDRENNIGRTGNRTGNSANDRLNGSCPDNGYGI